MTPRPPLELVVLPLLTLLSLAFSILSGSEGERVLYARVWGGPPGSALAVRMQVVEEEGGLERGVVDLPITVEGRFASGVSVREVRTGADGWVDVALRFTGSANGVHLEVRRSEAAGLPLASGSPAWSASAWSRTTRVSGVVPANPNDEVPVGVRFEPPVLSVPFSGYAVLELSPSMTSPLAVRVELTGARLLSPGALTLVPGRPERVHLTPSEHTATLIVLTGASSEHVSRTVTIPVRAGSLTMVAGPDELTILSPVPRERAYYSVVDERGRLGGGVVLLGPRPDGTSAGRLARGDLPLTELHTKPGQYLVLSSAPDGRAPSLVGLPLDGQTSTFDARDALLLNGRPAVLRTARVKAARVRWALLAYAALGATLSLVLFVWHIRRANERLRMELAEVGAPADARDRSFLAPASALLSLLFAFGLALTWILVR